MEIFQAFNVKRESYKLRSGPLQRTLDFLNAFGFSVSRVCELLRAIDLFIDFNETS